jgi:hypothetical protein
MSKKSTEHLKCWKIVIESRNTLTLLISNYYPIYMANNKNKKSSASEEYRWIPLDDPSVVFTTYDLGVSTALLCAGFQLLSVDKENVRKALFIFKKDDGIEDVADRYFSNRLEVKARSFFDNLKALKNQLYSE